MCQNYVNLFFPVTLVPFLTVIWVAKVSSYGICFHPNPEEISLGIIRVSAGCLMW